MDQYPNYLDAFSHSLFSQDSDAPSPFLSSESQPPSLSASPVSSEGSDSLIDEAVQYSLFGYGQSPIAIYNAYDQSSANNFIVDSTSVNSLSSPGVAVKYGHPFSYNSPAMFNNDLATSAPTFQPSIGYSPQESSSITFDYPVHSNNVSSLATMLADSAPFTTVAPSATTNLSERDVSAYKLSVGIGELSISSPASSPAPFLYAESVGSVCDPRVVSSPVATEQPTVDSDYSPSGESEVEDDNDHDYDYEGPQDRKKNRSARVSSAAHPYLKPASKAKDKKSRGTKLEIPIPVPGLTKNSRGRSVPTKSDVVYVDGTRMFWCNVKNCDKLFGRGEHLKRHITSIHTNDKPFRCKCKNEFSRRDNLFQHMRAKGCKEWYDMQGELKGGDYKPVKVSENYKDDMDDIVTDTIVARIMSDAKIAQEKRDRACKQQWARR